MMLLPCCVRRVDGLSTESTQCKVSMNTTFDDAFALLCEESGGLFSYYRVVYHHAKNSCNHVMWEYPAVEFK